MLVMMSDSHQSNQLTSFALGCIDNEYTVLCRLLYRNNNQHGKSLIFSHLKAVRGCMSMLSSESCKELLDVLDGSIRAGKLQKQSQVQLDDILSNAERAALTTEVCLEGVQHASLASQFIIKLLSLKVFVPLFSLLLALVARIGKCLSILATQFHARYLAMWDQIKHIGLTHSKFAAQISKFLAENEIPIDSLAVLSAVRASLDSDSSALSKKKAPTGNDVPVIAQPSISSLVEDTGDVVGLSKADSRSSFGPAAPVEHHSDEEECGLAIESDDERVPIASFASSQPAPPPPAQEPVSREPSTLGKRSLDIAEPAPAKDSRLAIDPMALFSDRAESAVSAGAKPAKSTFKKNKTLKALKKKSERSGADKQSVAKDDIDDIFGGL